MTTNLQFKQQNSQRITGENITEQLEHDTKQPKGDFTLAVKRWKLMLRNITQNK